MIFPPIPQNKREKNPERSSKRIQSSPRRSSRQLGNDMVLRRHRRARQIDCRRRAGRDPMHSMHHTPFGPRPSALLRFDALRVRRGVRLIRHGGEEAVFGWRRRVLLERVRGFGKGFYCGEGRGRGRCRGLRAVVRIGWVGEGK